MLKMRAVITLLVLLLSMCGSQTRSTQTEVHTESQSTGAAAAAAVTTQLDVSAELRELRDMVVELRVTLSFTQDELRNTKNLLYKIEAENDAQDTEMTAVKTRLAASETEVVNLRKEAAAQTADLRSVTERLVATETDMEHVKKDTAAQHTDLTTVKTEVMKLKMEQAAQDTQMTTVKAEVVNLKMEQTAQDTQMATVKNRLASGELEVLNMKKKQAAQEAELVVLKTRMDTGEAQVETRLSASETEVEKLKMEHAAQEAELTAVKTRLAATETEVVNLEKEITEKPKVAFSAGLNNSGYIEAGNTDLNLVFTKIITNVGQAYSNMTGFFTAPVKGVYYFRFTVMDVLSSRSMTIRIVKNGEQVMRLYEYDTDGQHSYLSSGVTLQLEVGDVVNMQLPAGYRLFDNSDNHSTFSGFLLFPL